MSLNREHSKAQQSTHSTAQQRNPPCTKQQPKDVPIEVRIKRSMYVHACCVPLVLLEHGALGICSRLFAPKMLDHLLTTSVCHPNPFFLASERSGRNRPLREAPCIYYWYCSTLFRSLAFLSLIISCNVLICLLVYVVLVVSSTLAWHCIAYSPYQVSCE